MISPLYTQNFDLGVIETLVNEMIDLISNKSFNKYLCVERFGERGSFLRNLTMASFVSQLKL